MNGVQLESLITEIVLTDNWNVSHFGKCETKKKLINCEEKLTA